MARISQETIDRIRNSADILGVISEYVNLKKRGRNYFGLCPFHHERTPSFSVAPDKEIFHCFGCGKGGNVFNFLMEHDNLSFVEAVQQLGNHCGIDVRLTGDKESGSLFTDLYNIHETAAAAYEKILFSDRGKTALEYLLNRGMKKEILKSYRVGFAPESWEFLADTVKDKHYSKECIEKSGLFGKGKQGAVDRFRSRIMFPIMNRSGKVIAFGGRAFESDDPAKYMNSPDTPLYHKSEVFYGFHKTAKAVRAAGAAILVEGYMDFLQLVQAGFENVLAVSGTAFADRHAVQIGKITRKVYLAYDGDEAGQKAALRSGYALLQNSISALVILVPEGLDPDDWVKNEGSEPFKSAIQNALPVLKFHLKKSDAINLSAVERSQLVKDILQEIAGVRDSIIRDDLLQTLANDLRISEQDMIRRFRRVSSDRSKGPQPKQVQTESPGLFTTVLQKAQAEAVCTLSLYYRDVNDIVRDNLMLITDPVLKQTAELILEHGAGETASVLNQFEDKREREAVARLLINAIPADDPRTVVLEDFHTLRTQHLRDKIQKARLIIREREAMGQDTGDILLEEGQLQRELRSLTVKEK